MDELSAHYRIDDSPLPDTERVFRAFRQDTGAPVIVKGLPARHSSAEKAASLRHEYAVLTRLHGRPVPRALGLMRFRGGLAMVMEPVAGRSLDAIEAAGQVAPSRFCDIAIAITKSLEAVHDAGLLHKDVKPQHFFVCESSGAATLIDFGSSTEVSREHARPVDVGRLEGTLAYIAPEQTGRMNRSVDRRSDLYSLGVTLYELAVGQRPFTSDDALELVHAHIVRTPAAPSTLVDGFPSILSDIVMRLLEKVPDDRYQTAAGLRLDLERARAELKDSRASVSFELGRDDHDGELRVPEKLYGRQEQGQELRSAFARVRNGAKELLLITGGAGVGKSALVDELHSELARSGVFASGKFDQYNRSTPYSALTAACGALVRTYLAAPSKTLESWQARLRLLIGENSRIVAELVPELKLALGPQDAPASLPPTEARNRFERCLSNFFQASANGSSPLVLFLDDLQWADSASLSVLQLVLSSPDQTHLLVIGSYRDQEVDDAHPLSRCLEGLEGRVPTRRIELEPLGARDVERMVTDALPFCSQPVEPFARLIGEKTSGNPFFVAQFLQRLASEGILEFDRETGFRWDMEAIARLDATDNVIDFIVRRLGDLDQGARELLPLAACIGHTFHFSTLMSTAQRPAREVAAALRSAVAGGFVVPLDESHRLLEELIESSASKVDAGYRFAHDRVQQAAHATITEKQRREFHLRIGRLLLAACGETGPTDEELFDVVGQLNRARELIVSDDERLALAHLNCRAAERAKRAMAHTFALELSGVCLELLGEKPWRKDHATCLTVHVVAAESHYLTGNHEEALATIDAVEARARSLLERVPARNLKANLLTNQGQFPEASSVCLATMALLGESLPDPQDGAAIGQAIGVEFAAFQAALGGREVMTLGDLPPMTDPEKLALITAMSAAISPTFQSNPALAVLVSLRGARLSIDYGTAPFTPIFYGLYGMVHNQLTTDYECAFQFGRLALELSQRSEHVGARGNVGFLFATFISPWVRPLGESIACYERGVVDSLDGGDKLTATYSMSLSLAYRFYAGGALPELARQIGSHQGKFQAERDIVNVMISTTVERAIRSLMKGTVCFGHFDGEGFSERDFEGRALPPSVAAFYGSHKAIARYFAGDPEAALRAMEEFPPLPGLQYNVERVFYHGLACADIAMRARGDERERMLAHLDEDIEKFSHWARSCAENYAARFELLRAEAFALRGEIGNALDAFERAIELANEAPALHHIALACERAGRFHHRSGRQRLAQSLLVEARGHYERWGASGKVAQLDEEFSKALRMGSMEGGHGAKQGTLATTDRTPATGGDGLDLTSAMRATHAISSELRLQPLVRRLMEILVENAGASRACLVLPRGEALEVRASLTVEPQAIDVDLCERLDETRRLPPSVVQYCARAREVVLLDGADEDARFAHDPLVREMSGHSAACLPLLHQGRLVGVLYLENDTGSGVFHAGRVARLEFLAGHAAVALYNACLYDELEAVNENLERRVRERTAELSGRNADMRRVLDNVAQGLLVIDVRGILSGERSLVVDEWFSPFEAGTDLVGYLASFDVKFARLFAVTFDQLIEGFLPEEVALAQLPADMTHCGRQFHFGYETIRMNDALAGLLVVVDDVTEEMKRAREDAEQREELAIGRSLSVDRSGLMAFFTDGRAIVDRLSRVEALDNELRGLLHTLKGSAGMLGFELVSRLCHEAEDAIEGGVFVPEHIRRVAQRWSALEETLEVLAGGDLRNRVDVTRADLEALASRLRAGAEASEVLEQLESWWLEPLSRPLARLGQYATALSRRLGRGELRLRIEDGALLGDADRGSKLWTSLVHLVRNAVDHGIETPDERNRLGKPHAPTLRIRASRNGAELCIEVTDDGRGVAWDRVKQRARELGLPSESRADLVAALFAAQFSTRTEVSSTSGRGLGLSAVQAEVEQLGGRITMESEPGQGCRFIVTTPAVALGVRPDRPMYRSRSSVRTASKERQSASP